MLLRKFSSFYQDGNQMNKTRIAATMKMISLITSIRYTALKFSEFDAMWYSLYVDVSEVSCLTQCC